MKLIRIAIAIITFTVVQAAHAGGELITLAPIIPADSQWTIVGAGPAGITVVGLLIDLGIDPKQITWIDPEFNVGRLGKYYASVPGNVKTKTFVRFIQSCKTFMECSSPALDALYTYDPEVEYPLHIIVDPLIDITHHLCKKVHCIQGIINAFDFIDNVWHVGVDGYESFTTAHVVLATGSHPRSLDYACSHEIPLDLALDQKTLATLVDTNDTIAVVGSAHSAILLLKFLTESSAGRIINFYKNPIVYNKPEVSLLGTAAYWAQNVLEANPPANLIRFFNAPEIRTAWLPICNKIIYAIGYDRNQVPPINGESEITYDDKTGVIGTRIFGIGIAFPETFVDEETGNKVSKIGLMGFMEYAQRIMPSWITKEPLYRFAGFEELFSIDLL